MLETSKYASNLTHELQRERGFTAGFLGSRGEQFVVELEDQRKRVDASRDALAERLPQVRQAHSAEGRMVAVLREAERLGQIRERVDGRTVESPSALRYYTSLTTGLIESVVAVAQNASRSEATTRLIALTHLMWLKESAGVERAVIANALALGRVTAEVYRRVVALAAAQGTYDRAFRGMAAPGELEILDAKLPARLLRETGAFRERVSAARENGSRGEGAVDGGAKSIQADTAEWFAVQTEKIDALRAVEAALIDNFLAVSKAWESDAREQVYAACAGLLTLVLIVGALATGLLLRLLKTLREATEVAESIALGRLGVQIHTGQLDELGRLNAALATMRSKLARVVREVRSGSRDVSINAAEIAQGSADLNRRSVAQAAAIEESASTLEEMSGTSAQAAETAEQARSLAEKTRGLADDGRGIAGAAMDAMAKVRTQSERIEAITEVIDDIAFQTNLLALNASVEAARAGDQGRGFAVVASEVRSLAQRTVKSSREIRELIATGAKAVDEGSNWVERTRQSLEEIAGGVSSCAQFLSEIASTSREHSLGITNLNQAISQLDAAAQQNAALVEESNRSAQLLKQRATHTLRLVDYFETEEGEARTVEAESDEPAESGEFVNHREADAGGEPSAEETWEDEEDANDRSATDVA